MATASPNSTPGAYYVSVLIGGKYRPLLGPFPDLQAAEDMVEAARIKAEQLDNRAFWMRYGTLCLPPDQAPPGVLNKYMGM